VTLAVRSYIYDGATRQQARTRRRITPWSPLFLLSLVELCARGARLHRCVPRASCVSRVLVATTRVHRALAEVRPRLHLLAVYHLRIPGPSRPQAGAGRPVFHVTTFAPRLYFPDLAAASTSTGNRRCCQPVCQALRLKRPDKGMCVCGGYRTACAVGALTVGASRAPRPVTRRQRANSVNACLQLLLAFDLGPYRSTHVRVALRLVPTTRTACGIW